MADGRRPEYTIISTEEIEYTLATNVLAELRVSPQAGRLVHVCTETVRVTPMNTKGDEWYRAGSHGVLDFTRSLSVIIRSAMLLRIKVPFEQLPVAPVNEQNRQLLENDTLNLAVVRRFHRNILVRDNDFYCGRFDQMFPHFYLRYLFNNDDHPPIQGEVLMFAADFGAVTSIAVNGDMERHPDTPPLNEHPDRPQRLTATFSVTLTHFSIENAQGEEGPWMTILQALVRDETAIRRVNDAFGIEHVEDPRNDDDDDDNDDDDDDDVNDMAENMDNLAV